MIESTDGKFFYFVIFIQDVAFDVFAEEIQLEVRMKEFDCTMPFDSQHKHLFHAFNGA